MLGRGLFDALQCDREHVFLWQNLNQQHAWAAGRLYLQRELSDDITHAMSLSFETASPTADVDRHVTPDTAAAQEAVALARVETALSHGAHGGASETAREGRISLCARLDRSRSVPPATASDLIAGNHQRGNEQNHGQEHAGSNPGFNDTGPGSKSRGTALRIVLYTAPCYVLFARP
jgi:hypothetical protein